MSSATATRYRALSFVALLVLAFSVTSFIGLRSAEVYETRGATVGFPQPVFGAEQLRLGVNAALEQYDDETLDARLSDLAARGLRTVRQEFRWDEIEPQRGQFDWSASDRILSATARHGLSVLPVLWTTPEWARAPSASVEFPATLTAPPADVADFARFVGAFAERYDARRPRSRFSFREPERGRPASSVIGYQIWDEPNLSAAWGNGLVNPTLYLQMLRAAREAIRSVNPEARIVLAGLAPTVERSNVNLAPQTYLLKLYQLGGHEAFDIAAAKAYGFDFPPDDRRVDPGVLNFSHLILMREVMVTHDDGHKAIWATPFGWNALPPGWQGEPSIWGKTTEQQQAEYTLRAVQRAAREWPWLGVMFADNLQPRPRAESPERDGLWGFALLDQLGRPRPVMEALTQAVDDATRAPRAQLFAACVSPQSLYRTLRLDNVMTAMPEVLASQPDCATPNPQATFTQGWRFGQLGADIPDRPDANVRIRFSGDALALIVRRGDYRAYTFVTVDGQPANLLPTEPRGAYLIMTSPGLYPVIETIPVASGLGPGEHEAEITLDRGWNQWALIGWSSRIFDFRFSMLDWAVPLIGVLSAVVLVWSWSRARWGEWVRGVATRVTRLDPRRLSLSAIAAALIFWFTSMLTWAQDAATAYRNLGVGPNVVMTGLASGLLIWSPAMIVSVVALVALFVLILVRLEAGLALLAFFVPFFLAPQRLFERAFSMPELLTFMCLASWAVSWLHVARSRLRKRERIFNLEPGTWNLFDWSALALIIVAVLSTTQAAFQTEALRELRLVIIEPALVYLMLRSLPSPPEGEGRVRGITLILDGYVLGAVAIALIGLVNYAQGDVFLAEFGLPRIKSVFGSANNDALYLERAFAVMLGLGVIGNWRLKMTDDRLPITNYRRWLYLLGLIPVTLALLLSQSRGALLLGAPAAVVVMALLAGGRWRWAGIGLLAALAIGFAALLSGTIAPLLEGTRFARFADVFDLQNSTGFFRLNLWQSALNMLRDHPLLGVGPDNFLYAYRSFYILPAAWQEPNLSHPHNIAFDFASRLGVLGLLAGVGLVVGYGLLVKRTMRVNRPVAIGCAGFLAAMLAHGLVDHSFFLVDLAFSFMLTAGVMAALSAHPSPQPSPKGRGS